jgi:hypothetical protein
MSVINVPRSIIPLRRVSKMANNDIKIVKTIKWPEVVSRVSSEKGVPKKQIEETVGAVTEVLAKLISESKPQKIGTATMIQTPTGGIRITKIPSEVRTDVSTGKQVGRDESWAISIATPRDFIDAANVGVVLEKDTKSDKTEKKSKAA